MLGEEENDGQWGDCAASAKDRVFFFFSFSFLFFLLLLPRRSCGDESESVHLKRIQVYLSTVAVASRCMMQAAHWASSSGGAALRGSAGVSAHGGFPRRRTEAATKRSVLMRAPHLREKRRVCRGVKTTTAVSRSRTSNCKDGRSQVVLPDSACHHQCLRCVLDQISSQPGSKGRSSEDATAWLRMRRIAAPTSSSVSVFARCA